MSHPLVRLQDLGESITQGLSVSRYRDHRGEPKPIVNVKDLDNLYIVHDLEQVMLNNATSIQRYRLHENDVIIAIRGTLLKSSVVGETSQGSIAGQNVAVFRPRNLTQVNPAYIAVLMRSQWMQKSTQVVKERSSTNLHSIRVSELREIKIPLPEMTIQNTIVQLFLLLESYKKITLDLLNSRQNIAEMYLLNLLEN